MNPSKEIYSENLRQCLQNQPNGLTVAQIFEGMPARPVQRNSEGTRIRRYASDPELNIETRVPNRPLFQRTVLYYNRLSFIFIEPIKDAKCPLFSRFWFIN
jgi:hypothetical protein